MYTLVGRLLLSLHCTAVGVRPPLTCLGGAVARWPLGAMAYAPAKVVVVLDARPQPEVACSSLIQTDNKLFNKVILVFSFLCEEAATMQQHAQDHLVPALLLLAEQPANAPNARPETLATAAMPLLLAVHQFVSRINSVAINLIHQLASLYEPKQRLFAATFRNVTMRRAFDVRCRLRA